MSSRKAALLAMRQTGYALKRAQLALRTSMDEALRPLDLTAPQFAVLSAIEDKPGQSNASLARDAFVTPQTMQAIIANLEKAGLLERAPDPGHGRILQAELTKKGQEVLRQAHKAAIAVSTRMLAGLSDADTARLETLLSTCAKNLESAKA
jgi:DNA-binding MarR family transcriptional regulator